jgi:hypothetical protein
MKVMCEELQSMEDNNTWMLCVLPEGKRALELKWVNKIKMDGDGKFEKYKPRLVVREYAQITGLDFDETWAPVV